MSQTFGARLIEERDRLKLSQSDICELTGINRKTQFAYEKDLRYPDAGYLMTLLQNGFDIAYMLTAIRPPRYGAIDEGLLCAVLTAVDAALASIGRTFENDKKAKLIALVYQTSAEKGTVDPVVVQKAIALAS